MRRNAVLAVFSIYQDFPQLIQDAPQFIFDYLTNVPIRFFLIILFSYLEGGRRFLSEKRIPDAFQLCAR